MSEAKRYVYVLQSKPHPRRHYVGLTSDVAARLEAHNGGQSASTAPHRPWRLLAAVEFANPHSAALFERYLKSASGRAFAKRHFV
jgi:putative endonuclease